MRPTHSIALLVGQSVVVPLNIDHGINSSIQDILRHSNQTFPLWFVASIYSITKTPSSRLVRFQCFGVFQKTVAPKSLLVSLEPVKKLSFSN